MRYIKATVPITYEGELKFVAYSSQPFSPEDDAELIMRNFATLIPGALTRAGLTIALGESIVYQLLEEENEIELFKQGPEWS